MIVRVALTRVRETRADRIWIRRTKERRMNGEREREMKNERRRDEAPPRLQENCRVLRCRDIKIFLIRVRSGRLPCFFNPRGLFAELPPPGGGACLPTSVATCIFRQALGLPGLLGGCLLTLLRHIASRNATNNCSASPVFASFLPSRCLFVSQVRAPPFFFFFFFFF